MNKTVLIEFTKHVSCSRSKGDRFWTDERLADIYVNRRKVAKIIRRKKPNV